MSLVGIHRWIEDAPLAFDFVRAGAAGEFRIADKPCGAMAGNVEFRNDANAALVGVGEQAANLFLGVIEAIGAVFVQLGEAFAFDAEALIFREVPVEDVHFYGFHAIDVAAQNFQRDEVAAGVDHRAAPGEAGRVFDDDCGSGETVWRNGDELQKSLQAVHGAEIGGGGDGGAFGFYFQHVRFIFADFLNGLAVVVGVKDQRGLITAGRLGGHEQAGLSGETRGEALRGGVQSRIGVTSKAKGESRINFQGAAAQFNVGGSRHEVERLHLLPSHRRH